MPPGVGRCAGLAAIQYSLHDDPTGAAIMSERSTTDETVATFHQADEIESAEKGAPLLAPGLW
jgi:hypothetical protein